MLSIEYFVSINYAPFIGIIFMLLFVLMNTREDSFIRRTFLLLLTLELVEMNAYSLELYYADLAEPTIMRIVLSAIGYSVRPILVYLIILLNRRDKNTRKWALVHAIPIIVNAAFAFSALFTDIVFTYTADNHFSRGPLGYMPQIVLVLYIALLTVNVIRSAKHRKVPETIIVMLSIVLTLVVILIETKYTFSSLGRTTIIMATIFYYVCFQTFIYRNQLETEQKRRRRYQKDSTTDQLTGLLNKTAFMNRFEARLQEEEGPSGLIFFDLDRFKEFNDTLGHLTGDELLKDVAHRLKKLFRSSDLIGRFGGDEFYIYVSNITYELLEEKAKLLISEMDISWEDTGLGVTASLGICFIPADSNPESTSVLELADTGLYEAKRAGRNCYKVLVPGDGSEVSR